MVRQGKNGPEFKLLPYPSELPEGTTGTILGAHWMQAFLGNHGASGLVIIDSQEEPHFKHVELLFRRVDFILDPAKPQFAYVLTEDGSLHRLDLLSGEIDISKRVTGPIAWTGTGTMRVHALPWGVTRF